MRLYRIGIISLFFISGPANPMGLSEAIRIGLRNNPGLNAAIWKARAALDSEKWAGGGAPTMLSAGLMNVPTDTFSLNQDMMNQISIGIKQKFFFPGKLSLRRAIAREYRRITELDVEAGKRRLVALVKESYFHLLFLQKSLSLTETSLKLLNRFRSMARTRYAVGKGLLQDITKADFEAVRLQETILNLKNRRKETVYLFNRLLGRDPSSPVKHLPLFNGETRLPVLATIRTRALASAITLRTARRQLARARLNERLARRLRWPDFSVGAGYGIRTRDNSANLFSISVELSIPLFSRTGKKVASARNTVRQKQESLNRTRLEILRTASSLFTEIHTIKRLLSLYEKRLLPLARLSVSSALSSYQVGRVEFLSLVSAELLHYRYRIARENSLRLFRTRLAQLEFLTAGSYVKERKQ